MSKELKKIVLNALEDVKGKDIEVLNVADVTDVTDTLIVASGTSSRQVKALANSVVVDGKKAGYQPIGIEGMDAGDWVLVDYGDLVVHVMLPATRAFYDLEKLWSFRPDDMPDIATE